MCTECPARMPLHRACKLLSTRFPFCPFWCGVSLLKPNSRKKGTLMIKGLLENLVEYRALEMGSL